jgi:hypothetical protein
MAERGVATSHGQVMEAVQLLLLRASEYDVAERKLADYGRPVSKYNKALAALQMAARDLTNATDELPPDKRPEGWGLGPDGEVA